MPLETVHLGPAKSRSAPSTPATATAAGASQPGEFQPTAEELQSIQEKMKDPKFVELMHEYMQSLQDPETRREEEAYLEQVEREAREGGDFSFEFVFPRPAFVVELRNPTTRRVAAAEVRKVLGRAATGSSASSSTATTTTTDGEVKDARTFINFCSSEKVEPHREERVGSGRESNWHVPVSVSAKRLELLPDACGGGGASATLAAEQGEEKGERRRPAQLCYVFDAVYHPTTLSLADRSTKFLCFLVEIAVEQINAGYQESNGFEFLRLPSSVKAVGTPQNQTVRRKAGAAGSPLTAHADPVLTKPTKHLYPPKAEEARTRKPLQPPISTSPRTAERGGGERRGSGGDDTAPCLPPHTIAHRGRIDISDAWQWKVREQRVGVPEALVVKLTFAGVSRAADLDVDITEDGGALRITRTPGQDRYEGLLVLPFTVEATPKRAALEKRSGELTLVLAVVPPQLRQEDEAAAAEVRDRFIGAAIEPLPTRVAEPARAATASEPEVTAACGAAAQTAESTPAPAPTAEEVPAVESGRAAPPAFQRDPPPPPSVSDFTADTDRAELMRRKVEEVRRAREAAAAAVGETAEGGQAGQTASEAPVPEVPPAHASPQEAEQMPFIQKRDPAHDAEEAELRARQESWAAMVKEQMEMMAAKEEAEAAAAARVAEREKAKAAKKLAALQQAAAAEARVRATMASVPLANKYIFTID